MAMTGCIHHWLVDIHNVGRCRKCGAMKDFGKLLDKGFSPKLAHRKYLNGMTWKRGRRKKGAQYV